MSVAPRAGRPALSVVTGLTSAWPVLVLLGLAGFTWWLVQSSPKLESAKVARVGDDRPDYILSHARLARFDENGRLEAVVDGNTMRHHPLSGVLDIDSVVMSGHHEDGIQVHGLAQQGHWQERDEVLVLEGAADVVITPKSGDPEEVTRVTGERLRIDTRKRTLDSAQPVHLSQAHRQIQAQSLHHDDIAQLTLLGGRLYGDVQMKPE